MNRIYIFLMASFTLSMVLIACKDKEGRPGSQVPSSLSNEDRMPNGGVEKHPGDGDTAVSPTVAPNLAP